MKKLRILNYQESNTVISNFIINKKGNNKLNILEAGCGRVWPYDLSEISFELVGVDMDEKALKHRKEEVKDLDKAIVGDLEKIELDAQSFDIVYNSFLLEHIKNADDVIEKFIKWLKKEGLLIVKVPNRQSVFGFVTRLTPFWFHILYHRYVKKDANAGKKGFGPYQTFYHPIISRKGIHRFSEKQNLKIVDEFYIDSGNPRLTKIFISIFNFLSFNMLSKHMIFCFVIKKQ